MSESIHASNNPHEVAVYSDGWDSADLAAVVGEFGDRHAGVTLYPDNIAAFAGARTAPVADRPATPALAGLIEVERRLGELAGKLEHRHPTRPLPWQAGEVLLLHDSVDELRQVVAVIAGALGLL